MDVVDDPVAVMLRDPLLEPFDLVGTELLDLAAGDTDDMVMVSSANARFVHSTVLAEHRFANDSTALQ